MSVLAQWSLIVGGIFLISGLGRGPLKTWPISLPIVYLLVGVGIGPWGLNLLQLDLVRDAKTIEVLTEIAVLLSLLTAGIRLTPSWKLYLQAPIPLATVGMTLTVAGIALLGYFAIGLPIGAAVLLGAVLAPTDPVLANEIQVNDEEDRDRLRYALTGEAGLNDGAAFPFIMLGLGLLGLNEIGTFGWQWFATDLLWATVAGLASGWVMGYFISRLTVLVKRKLHAPVACEELLTLGLIGLAYGVAMAIQSYGFLAVFAAGVATRFYAQRDENDDHPDETIKTVAQINEQFERILEVAVVVVIGVLLSNTFTIGRDWWIALVLFAIIRPVAAFASLRLSPTTRMQTGLAAFFGIRGIGSLYYLTYAIGEDLDDATAERLAGIVLTTITLSLLVHSNIASIVLSRYTSKKDKD